MAGTPPYLRIAAEIRQRITDGELRTGDHVPSARAITREWGVAIATATRALAALRQEGLVRAVPGVGTVVAAQQAPPRSASGGAAADPVRDRIVRAAIRIADAEGLAALTMRRIGSELDVATMSLYRHLRGKGELEARMAEAAFAERPLPADPPPGWRPRLELAARTQWQLYRAHPWLPRTINMNRPLIIPSGMAHIEFTLTALDGLGLDDNTRLHTAIALFGYVRGAAADLETEARAAQDTGLDGEEWLDAQERPLSAVFALGDFPAFAAVRRRPGVDVGVESLFGYGLARYLDGVAAILGEHGPT
ncbi:GntR family transcriptional regulator [Streptomyces sp. A7024]|uniref:GntR family transcriptional regulator n=1 Tax=Streptomyces coryli TaxID=1128680 RepID=A0A6G4TWX7_9ACTN|nr:TetR/AcrR family transcriptional regulator C-terminal domain-containing protein [Streptomyces coryli]NGN63547.1 GntR family transcriptional regulator [Streptomyces coryli]